MGNALPSSSSSHVEYQQLLDDLKANQHISLQNLDTLMECMDSLFSKVKKTHKQASGSTSSPTVSLSACVGRRIVESLSTQIESQIALASPKWNCINQKSANRIKEYVRSALNSNTMKLVRDVLDGAKEVPYVGVAVSIVIYVLELAENSSANVQESMELLEHLYNLAKCMKDVATNENANRQLEDMFAFIVKSTVSLAQQMSSSTFRRFAFAYPDSAELQNMRNGLMLKYQHTQLWTLMDIYKNVPRFPQAPSKVYRTSNAVGIEGEKKEVKIKLNLGNPSRKILIIYGLGGMGKTTLADHVFNFEVDKSLYSRCKLEMDIKSTDIPKLQFQLLNQVFQETENVLNATEGQRRVSKAIEEGSYPSKPLFLYIDNACIKGEVDSLLPANALSLLPEGSRMMVTTRNLKEVMIWIDIAGFMFEVFKMEETSEAKKMLSYYALGDENDSFEEDVNVDGLLKLCMGVPLIIQMAAKKLRDLNVRRSLDMAEACRSVTEHMLSLRTEKGWEKEDMLQHMHRMVDFVYDQLPENFQRILLDIVFFFINWKRYKLVCMFGEIPIGELEDAALLSTNEERRVKVHDIIQVRAHAISQGKRICDKDSWERFKKHPKEFQTIEGLNIHVEDHDIEYVSRCDKTKILILQRGEDKLPLKISLPRSIEILCLKGPFLHDQNLHDDFRVLKLKMNKFETNFTNYQSFRKAKYLDLVKCKGIDISTCFSNALSSCRRLRLHDEKVEMFPHGNETNHYQLESLKIDKCYNLRMLPVNFEQTFSSLKILSIKYCQSIENVPTGFEILKNLEKLDAYGCRSLKALCENFGRLSKLKDLNMGDCESLETLPPSFGLLENLEILNMNGCESLTSLCENFGRLSKLKHLNIGYCESLEALPLSFGLLENLEKLDMSGCESLKFLCGNFGSLSKLKDLKIADCVSLETLPPNFGLLQNLEILDMPGCKILKSLPENFGKLLKLKVLNIGDCESLLHLPSSFGLLRNLGNLWMYGCKNLKNLCEDFGMLSKLEELDMRNCKRLEGLPNGFGLLENLTSLELNGCSSLKTLGEGFGSLQNLKRLKLVRCTSFEKFPSSFGSLLKLISLDLRGCVMLENLPEGFKNMDAVNYLDISHCSKINMSVESLPSLHILEVSGSNGIDEKVVDDLLRMPSLFSLTISNDLQKSCYESYAWQRRPLPIIYWEDDDLRRCVKECMFGGGGGDYWRMEGDKGHLVCEDAHSSPVTQPGSRIAILITGLNSLTQQYKAAVHQVVNEGYQIVYVDTGISRWRRYNHAYAQHGRAFKGEVPLTEVDMMMIKGMLRQLELPSGCFPRVWTSPFPKNCLVFADYLYNCSPYESRLIKGDSVMEDHEGKRHTLSIGSAVYNEEYCERVGKFERFALPSLGFEDVSSRGLAKSLYNY